jgi:hypothetical protein
MIMLMNDLEDEFSIRIGDNDFEHIKNVQDIVQYLLSKIEQTPATAPIPTGKVSASTQKSALLASLLSPAFMDDATTIIGLGAPNAQSHKSRGSAVNEVEDDDDDEIDEEGNRRRRKSEDDDPLSSEESGGGGGGGGRRFEEESEDSDDEDDE